MTARELAREHSAACESGAPVSWDRAVDDEGRAVWRLRCHGCHWTDDVVDDVGKRPQKGPRGKKGAAPP